MSGDKIATVAELKRRVWMAEKWYRQDIIDILDEFEAGLRERIKHLEKLPFGCEENAVDELRRVLGEGGE